ncbi:MAG TPA: hypothetical protein DD415_01530 [Clostridiales bacterium]|nr:hypothetical protein [Clostridiales bacterium]
MNISQNLQYLRKRDKITQEELADRLGVSRQSVSKWETGEAYPETDKLITLCDLFGVSLDELMRTDLTATVNISEEPKPKACDGGIFAAEMDKFSRAIAAGVFLILFGVAVCVALAGYSLMASEKYSELISVMGAVSVLLFVAVAVFLFIYFGIEHDRFRKEHSVIEYGMSEDEIKAFSKKFTLMMAALVSGILVGVILLVTMSALIDAEIINTKNQDAVYCFVTAVFFVILAVCVGGLTYYGIQHSKYDLAEYNKQTKKELNPSPRSKLKDAICGAVMMFATALFLILGFVGGWWHPAWVVFPVGGIICGIIGAIMNAKDDH